ncbi:biotin-dependent carboxyltransferase family protein [Thermaerobacter sp. PB12/4term]|uniref:5-oxoprolinase subunit C family protein n=1 Tax=Thermaerobacter sp. PB12/4term TaxID=2293838 RepID=UPI000E325E41|nr:biotin-dependent carboxyltransferase family protein [Thermaerobacter sp. PB12/4term]QIA27239.1 biotin-dependent carboxyltransferase family protein [Thermaerobacter sp. PB12/4term]
MMEILNPGLYTTIQDLGRPGLQHLGVPVQGAADVAALILGNRLVGNEPGAAALEITLLGPSIRFHAPAAIAVTGADLGPTLDGRPLPTGQVVLVERGGVLAFRGGTRGCRAMLCVAGGIAVEPVAGSRSSDPLGRLGGLPGRPGLPLQAGDRLPLGRPAVPLETLAGRRVRWTFVPDAFVARVVPGPQAGFFPPEAWKVFWESEYTVTAASDRMGIRLEGPPVPRPPGEVLSEGQPLGAIQVPPSGQPIVLLAGRATVGGYPKLGVVVTPDLSLLAQARPGDRIRFRPMDGSRAEELYRHWWRLLHSQRVIVPGLATGDQGPAPDAGRREGRLPGAGPAPPLS